MVNTIETLLYVSCEVLPYGKCSPKKKREDKNQVAMTRHLK